MTASFDGAGAKPAAAGVGPMRLYVAGPMTGLPEFNYPEFNRVAAVLTERGFAVENPALNPEPPCGTWAGWLRIALTQMMRCDGVARLPDWQHSRGAMLEVYVARSLGMPVLDWDRWQPEMASRA